MKSSLKLNSLLKTLSAIALTTTFLTGCVSTQDQTRLDLKPFAKNDEAVVYFYRTRTSLSGRDEPNPPKIFVNNEELGVLPNGSFKATIIKELSNKTISVHKTIRDKSYSDVIIQEEIDLSGAARYFIKLKDVSGYGEPQMIMVSEEVALKEMRKLKALAGTVEKDGVVRSDRKSLVH